MKIFSKPRHFILISTNTDLDLDICVFVFKTKSTILQTQQLESLISTMFNYDSLQVDPVRSIHPVHYKYVRGTQDCMCIVDCAKCAGLGAHSHTLGNPAIAVQERDRRCFLSCANHGASPSVHGWHGIELVLLHITHSCGQSGGGLNHCQDETAEWRLNSVRPSQLNTSKLSRWRHDPYAVFRTLCWFLISSLLHSLALSEKLRRFPLSSHHTVNPFCGRLIYST